MFEKYLPPEIFEKVRNVANLQEIHIRAGYPVGIINNSGLYYFNEQVSYDTVQSIFSRVCSNSVYALKEEIKNGFITLQGGHRVGICGRCVITEDKTEGIVDITALNFRVAREFINCSLPVFRKLKSKPQNVVFISPPNSGKTTYLRDLCRLYSIQGYTVSVVDERGEIAPFSKGESVFSFGKGVDVLRYCNKAKGMMQVLRTMNPEIVATDEIGNKEEGQAISEITKCGVHIITTFHGADVDDFKKRFNGWEMFRYAVLLNKNKLPEEIVCLSG